MNMTPKLKKKRTCREIVLAGLKYILLVAGAIVMVAPVLWMLSTSLTPDSVIISYQLIPSKITFENYVRAWDFPGFSATL